MGQLLEIGSLMFMFFQPNKVSSYFSSWKCRMIVSLQNAHAIESLTLERTKQQIKTLRFWIHYHAFALEFTVFESDIVHPRKGSRVQLGADSRFDVGVGLFFCEWVAEYRGQWVFNCVRFCMQHDWQETTRYRRFEQETYVNFLLIIF